MQLTEATWRKIAWRVALPFMALLGLGHFLVFSGVGEWMTSKPMPPAERQERYNKKLQADSCDEVAHATFMYNNAASPRRIWAKDSPQLDAYFSELDALYEKWCKK